MNINSTVIGIFISFIIAFLSTYLGNKIPIIGAAVFAILIGMIFSFYYKGKHFADEGLRFCSKKVLQYAVILLGFGLNLKQVLVAQVVSFPIILSTISISLIVSYIFYRITNIEYRIATLIGVGSSICGGSAIAATAPIIDAKDDEIAKSISVVFLFNILAALIFPNLGEFIGMSNTGFGLFAGSAINDTSSVTAAASIWDGLHNNSNALEYATVVKLTRTLAIIPISIYLSLREMKKRENSSNVSLNKIFPMFVFYFILASIFTTICLSFGVDKAYFNIFKIISKFLITMAMASIGVNTHLFDLFKGGFKSILLGLICWLSISAVCLFMQNLLNLI